MNQPDSQLISKLGLGPLTLAGQTVLVSGAGGGIGFETARALLWLGANVVIAEVNPQTGSQAVKTLSAQFDPEKMLFVQTDVGDEASVARLYESCLQSFKKVDAVINNATIAVLGRVVDLTMEQWDASYHVNLRGPVLLARTFLPGMVEREHGVFLCVSSTGAAYLGGYETFKAAQVHLAETLEAELADSGVYALTIGPGLVPTETAQKAIAQVAPAMGLSLDEFYRMNQNVMLSVEEAGVGFALAVVFAERFTGQEISSIQAIKAADITYGSLQGSTWVKRDPQKIELLVGICRSVCRTLKEQSDGWKARSIFERQWVIRDFKKTAGMPVEEWLASLDSLEKTLQANEVTSLPPLQKLADYYAHLAEMAKGYEKNPAKLEENLKYVYSWRDEVTRFLNELNGR